MGDIAAFPNYKDESYSENELRQIARTMFSTGGDRHLQRIANAVNRSLETIKQWHREDNWTLARQAVQQKRRETKLGKVEKLLQEAGLKSEQDDAVETLKLLADAKVVARRFLNQSADRLYPEALDKILAAIERIEKLSKSAYGRL